MRALLSTRSGQNDPIAAGSTADWNGLVTYDMFEGSHRVIRGMGAQDMTITLTDVEIVWIE